MTSANIDSDCLASATPSVSLIVPIFNVEPYLEECLKSLLRQDFIAECEIFLINDCSTDGSESICKRYEREYPNIIRYTAHTKNQGVSRSRNSGIESARGEYLMFVDPDDMLPANAVFNLYRCAQQFNADIVKGNNTVFNEGGSKSAAYNVASTSILIDEDIFAALLTHEHVRGHPWGKLFRRQYFSECLFPDNVRMAQDLVYCARTFSKAKKLVLLNEHVYCYRLRSDGSTGNKYISGTYEHWFDSVHVLSEHIKSHKQQSLLLAYRVRTLHQAIREIKALPYASIQAVLPRVIGRQSTWGVSLRALLVHRVTSLKTYWRFLQYQYFVRRLSSSKKAV